MMEEPQRINGYEITGEWKTSGDARWTYARKNGKNWFIKEFFAPKYKEGHGFTREQVEASREKCRLFRETKETLYQKVREADTGNIICMTDFFRFGNVFYAVSEKVDVSSVPTEDICRQPPEKRLLIMKVLAYNIKSVHEKGVIHADLKPDNILIKKTVSDSYTVKLIDFDASFLTGKPRRGEDIKFDVLFAAPETHLATMDESICLTNKIDIFAMGILFHLYYTGKYPEFRTKENKPAKYEYVWQGAGAIGSGEANDRMVLDSKIPNDLASLIRDMLEYDPKKRPDAAEVFRRLTKDTSPHTLRSGPKNRSETRKGGFYTPGKL